MIAVAPPLILLLMWLGQPGQSAVLLGTAAAMSSTALVSRQLADQGELTTATAAVPSPCWSFGTWPACPVGLAGDLGARRVAEDRACAARSIRCAAAVRGSGPRLAPSVAWSAGLGGAAGPRGIVRARLLVRGGGCRRRAARGRRIRRPGAFLAGMVLGESDFRHHMESHLRPFRDVLSGLFFVTIGLQLDVAQIVAAPLAVLGWLLALVPLKMGLNFLALRATRLSALDAWRTSCAGAWRRVCAATPGHGHAAARLPPTWCNRC